GGLLLRWSTAAHARPSATPYATSRPSRVRRVAESAPTRDCATPRDGPAASVALTTAADAKTLMLNTVPLPLRTEHLARRASAEPACAAGAESRRRLLRRACLWPLGR